jgi:hypothetical protein
MARRRDVPTAAIDMGYGRQPEMMRHVGGGVPMGSATSGGNRSRQWDLEGLIDGDNVTAQTPNGTAHATGTGWNKVYPYSMPELPTDSTRPGGRSSRTGE